MIIEDQLRNEIARVVNKHASLQDLYSWLMERNWNVLRNSEPSARDLAVEVEAILYEWSESLKSESKAVQELAALAREPQLFEIRVRIDFDRVGSEDTFATAATSPLPLQIPVIQIPLPAQA